ncbi:MAG: energy-coupling factor transporter transmembrane protein EcfT [Clostridiales bacterium]|nr:energy-coupling factor transporter transmembrane protein EcfT [Clostridiales bacterium]
MIRDITLGQYYPGNSTIHRLDARVKIASTLVFVVALFIVRDFIGFAVCAAALSIVVALSRVPLSFILRGLKPIFVIIMLTFVLNLFMTGGEPVFRWGLLTVTREGAVRAVFLVIRLVLLIIGSSVLTLTTKPISLTDGMEYLLKPLKLFRVPTHELAMMMSIALRFIPTLLEETDKIMKAQMARGADFESGNIFRRAKSLIPILVPLFINAFRIAQELAMAMEARCYRGGGLRTRLHAMKIKKPDVLAIVCVAVFTCIITGEAFFL